MGHLWDIYGTSMGHHKYDVDIMNKTSTGMKD